MKQDNKRFIIEPFAERITLLDSMQSCRISELGKVIASTPKLQALPDISNTMKELYSMYRDSEIYKRIVNYLMRIPAEAEIDDYTSDLILNSCFNLLHTEDKLYTEEDIFNFMLINITK